MVTWHEACVGGRLARALEPFGGSEFAYDDRSGLEPDARDRLQQHRLQQRGTTLQLRILLDVLLNFFFQVFKLLFNFLKKATVRTANCLILGFIQSARASGFSPSSALDGPA